MKAKAPAHAPSTTRRTAVWATDETEERVEALLAQMTLEEKVAFVTGDLNWDYGFYSAPIERLRLPALQMADGPAGVRINKGDVHHGQATALPAPIALAATWDPKLAHEYGKVIGVECRATDHNVSLGPAIDIARVPLAGRTFESYGEDPTLTAAIGVEYVRGVQEQGVQACAKHFALNNQEDHRSSIDAIVDERAMREIYLPPFEALINQGGVASLMASFNRVNGEFACESPTLLTDLLRGVFGFRGWIMSDYGANHSTAPAANAGLDQEQPSEGHWGSKLLAAVQADEVASATIDEKIRRILRPLIGLDQIENPVGVHDFPVDAHHAVAQRIAEASMVLLRNDGVLPLAGVRRVALIGTDVDTAGAKGGGSSLVRGIREVSPLEGLARALGDEVDIRIAYGAEPVTPGALLPGPDAVPSSFFSTSDGDRGLRAEYWTNPNFEGEPFLSRTEGQIEHNLGFHNFPGFNASSPRYEQMPGELNGQISARWAGVLTVPVTGTYRFTTTSLGRFSFMIDGEVVAASDASTTGSVLVFSDTSPDEADKFAAATESVVDPAGTSDLPEQPTYNAGATDAVTPDLYEVSLLLVAHRPYALQFDYAADDPSQGFLMGAKIRLGWIPPEGVVSSDIVSAAELAAESDVAIVIVRSYEAESDDRPHLRLPSGQNQLIRAVLAANPRTVVVLMTGAPVELTTWGAEPAALLQAWFPGQTQGDALARVLTGQAEPGGRLPLTLPRDLSQTPASDPRHYPGVDGRAEYREGVFVGYRAIYDGGPQPTYSFGHGLSYTSFAYDSFEIDSADGELAATVSITVRNVGGRPGTEVVQAYVGELSAPVATPKLQLAAFAKVHLEPGESTQVRLEISRRAVSYFDIRAHDWVAPLGVVEVLVGASSRDIRASGHVVVS